MKSETEMTADAFREQILKAIQGHDLDQLDKLLKQNGINPSKINDGKFNSQFILILNNLSSDEIAMLFNSTKFKKALLYSSILKASQYGTTKTLKTLLNLMPQLDQQDRDINKVIDPKTGDSPLYLAVRRFRPENVQTLLELA